MESQDNRPSRGRPQTLKRNHVVQTAMISYWADGPTEVAISEICQLANVSKPSVYREFGSDDGLKEAVLEAYHTMVSTPIYNILEADQAFSQTLEALITFTTQDRKVLGIPAGCLHVAMRARRSEFGNLTREKIDVLRLKTLQKYEDWINRAKSKGEFRIDLSTDVVALYLDAQNGSAMQLQKEGVSNDVIETVLRTAFLPLK